MNKQDLEKIITIAEEGSMARAAQKLFLTQPGLSKCLTKVEEELGEPLFTRRPSGLVLTYSGECFLKRAYQIVRLYGEMESEFSELNQMKKGVLKLGTPARLGALVLPGVLKRFHEMYPDIKMELIEETSSVLEDKLIFGAIDIAVLCLPLKNENIKYEVFYEDDILVIAPKNHPICMCSYEKKGKQYLPLEEIAKENLILTKRGKKTRQAADRLMEQLKDECCIIMESQNIETVIRLVSGGLGISLVPRVFAETYGNEQEINCYYLEEHYNPFWQWAVIYSSSVQELSRPSRELYQILCGKAQITHHS